MRNIFLYMKWCLISQRIILKGRNHSLHFTQYDTYLWNWQFLIKFYCALEHEKEVYFGLQRKNHAFVSTFQVYSRDGPKIDQTQAYFWPTVNDAMKVHQITIRQISGWSNFMIRQISGLSNIGGFGWDRWGGNMPHRVRKEETCSWEVGWRVRLG